jgi:histone-lysine N-methyltransferase SETMAR
MAPGTTIMSEVYCEMSHKLRRSIQNKQKNNRVFLLHDNARPQTAARTNDLIKRFNWEIFDHPSYSPELAPNDYHLFSKMKVCLATQHFHSKEKLMDGVSTTDCITWRHRSLRRDYKN